MRGSLTKRAFTTSAKPVFVMDGGLSEELMRKGVPDDRRIWSAVALVKPEYHRNIVGGHLAFLRSGSQLITTSNYAVTSRVFSRSEVKKYTTLAGRLAHQAVEEFDSEPRPLIAGCLPPLSESYRPDLVFPTERLESEYKDLVECLEPNVDLFLAETLSCLREARAAVETVKANSSKPVWVSFTLADDGRLRTGETFAEAIRAIPASAILANCCLPEAVDRALDSLDKATLADCENRGVRIGAYANALPAVEEDFELGATSEGAKARNDMGPKMYIDHVKKWMDSGATIVGGCCKIFPEHISEICRSLRDSKL